MTVKEMRKKAGLTQAAFAEKFHIPVRTIENWEVPNESSQKRHPPRYVLELLERCVMDDDIMPSVDGTMPMQEIRELTKLSKKDFAEKYHIPKSTLSEWENGHKSCPIYVKELLERCVTYDERPRWYIHRLEDDIKKGNEDNILGVFDLYREEALVELDVIKKNILAGAYDEKWNLTSVLDRLSASDNLIIEPFQAHELR